MTKGGSVALPAPIREREIEQQREEKLDKPYNVILLNDNDHTYVYVITMLRSLFGHSRSLAFKMACEVDTVGRVTVYTGQKEHAEFYKEQIEAYGPDKLIFYCKGSMTAKIEPAA